MAYSPNLRLSSTVLGSLAEPNFARAAGMSIGAGMLGAQRRADEAEARSTQEATIELLRKAQVAQETGDMRMLTGLGDELNALLPQTKNEQARQAITEGLESIQGKRAATQKTAQTNTAMSILKTEQAIEEMNNSTAPMTNEEYMERAKVQGALEDRLALMKQNTGAATEAATIQYNSDIQAFERDAALRTKKVEAAEAALASLDPNSDQYSQLVSSLNSQGLGQAVKNNEKKMQAATKVDLEIKQILSEVGPLNSEEIADAEELNLPIKDFNSPLARKIYNAAKVEQSKMELAQALRPVSVPEKPRAEAIAKAQLNLIAREGDYFDMFWNRDISSRIEDLLEDPDQVANLMGRIAGLAEEDIPNEVNAWLYENFPDEMNRSKAFANKNQADARDVADLTNSILGGRDLSGLSKEEMEEARAVAQKEAELALAGAIAAFDRQETSAKPKTKKQTGPASSVAASQKPSEAMTNPRISSSSMTPSEAMQSVSSSIKQSYSTAAKRRDEEREGLFSSRRP
jgi:hypothetical protein